MERLTAVEELLKHWKGRRHDTQHNDIQHNDKQHYEKRWQHIVTPCWCSIMEYHNKVPYADCPLCWSITIKSIISWLSVCLLSCCWVSLWYVLVVSIGGWTGDFSMIRFFSKTDWPPSLFAVGVQVIITSVRCDAVWSNQSLRLY